jgi:REP element-mobilizing transposase RayT
MRYPKRIRLPHEIYANRAIAFHPVIHAHPAVERFPVPVMDAVWDATLGYRGRPEVDLLVACLMPDHVHLLARPGEIDLLAFLRRYKTWTTRKAWSAGHRGVLWQPRAFDRAIRDEGQLEAVARYVIENPVQGSLVESPESWPYAWAWWQE